MGPPVPSSTTGCPDGVEEDDKHAQVLEVRTSNLKDIQKIEKLDGKNRPYIVVYFLDTLLIYLLVPASHLF